MTKAKSIWLKRTVKVHRRQWGFCLLCSQLHVILFGASSPSHPSYPGAETGMAHRVLAQTRVFAFPSPSIELWIIVPNSKALKHTHWSIWFWIFFFFFPFWSLWRETAIQRQSYPESVCTKSSGAQRQCRRVKAVLRSRALSKRHWKVAARLSLPLDLSLCRWGATRLLLTSPHEEEWQPP